MMVEAYMKEGLDIKREKVKDNASVIVRQICEDSLNWIWELYSHAAWFLVFIKVFGRFILDAYEAYDNNHNAFQVVKYLVSELEYVALNE